MAPTPLTKTNRYFPPGTRKVYYMPTSASYLAPTRAEINAGTDLTGEIASMSGWSVTSQSVQTPDLGGPFTSEVPGRETASSCEIEFYCSSTGSDVRGLLPRNTSGYVILAWEGDVAGQFMDVYPVRVMADAVDSTIDDPGKVTISFAITQAPAQRVTIPA